MPADPPPPCGRAARMPERVPVSGEGADRDQAPKRARCDGNHGTSPDRRADKGLAARPPHGGKERG
jgi:hypothetical protein